MGFHFTNIIKTIFLFLLLSACSDVKMNMELLVEKDAINKLIEVPKVNYLNQSNVRFNGLCRDKSSSINLNIQDSAATPTIVNVSVPCIDARFTKDVDLSSLADGKIKIHLSSSSGLETQAETIKDVVLPNFTFTSSATSSIHQGSILNHTLNFNESGLVLDKSKIRLVGASQGCVLEIEEYLLDSRRWDIEISNCTGDGNISLTFDEGAFVDKAGNSTAEQTSLGAVGVYNNRTQLNWVLTQIQSVKSSGVAIIPFKINNFNASSAVPTWPGITSLLESSGDTSGCVLSESGTFPNLELRISGCTAAQSDLKWRLRKDAIPNPAGLYNLDSEWSSIVRVDNTAPTVNIVSPATMAGGSGTTFTWQLTFSGADNILLSSSQVVLTGDTTNCAVTLGGVGNIRTVSVSGCSTASGSVSVNLLPGAASDLAGNSTTGVSLGSLSIVNSGPTLSIGTPNVTAINNLGTLQIPLVYTNATSVSLTVGDITVVTSGTVTGCQLSLGGTGLTNRTINISNCGGDGDVKIQVAAGTAVGATALTAGAAGPSAAVIIDNTVPTFTMASTGGSVKGGAFDVSLQFSEAMANLTNIFSVNDGSISNFTSTSQQIDFKITPTLTVENLNLTSTANVFRDVAGNTMTVPTQSYIIGLPPLITLATSDGLSTYTDLFQFDVISNRSIQTPTSASFQVSGMSLGLIVGALNRYTVYATPQLTAMSVSMPANKVIGVPSGLGNVASNNLSLSYVPPVTLGFEKTNYEFQETNTNTNHEIKVIMSSVRSYDVSVQLELDTHQGDSISSFANLVNQTVTIPAGSISATIPITVYGNGAADGPKRVYINLKSSQIGVRFNNIKSRVVIFDDESAVAVAKIAVATNRVCAISTANQLRCWGVNSLGQVGDGTNIDKSIPVLIDSGASYSQVSLSDTHSCAITVAGSLKCWGYNGLGQLGDGTSVNRLAPVVIDSGVSYGQVVVSSNSTCGITTSGVLKCWGYNSYGQLGDGTTSLRSTPTVIDAGVGYSQVVMSGFTTCGITSAGVLKCWGSNSYGQLGDGTIVSKSTPTLIDSGVAYAQISKTNDSTCGITTSGDLKCWGSNSSGQLGDGTTVNKTTPTLVDSGVGYTQIASFGNSTCGITISGDLKCWGSNSYGQLGDGTSTSQLLPVLIDSGVSYSQIAGGSSHTCGVTTSGVLKCWGSNSSGQIGDGTQTSRYLPVQIDSASSYSAVSTLSNFTCGVSTAGVLKCWGSNGNYGLANSNTPNKNTPQVIQSGQSFSQVSQYSSLCAITSSGQLRCIGSNSNGLLGDGTSIDKFAFVHVDAGMNFQKVSLGSHHGCSISNSGVLKCWGYNSPAGKIGDGSRFDRAMPVVVDSGVNYIDVSVSSSSISDYGQSCGVTSANVLKCWGGGIGTRPSVIDSAVSYLKIDTSSFLLGSSMGHACGITTANALKCWGNNGGGQLGTGDTLVVSSPVVIDPGVSYQQVAVGGYYTCAITASGVLQCWGSNSSGELGLGDTNSRLLPAAVDAGTTYSDVSAGPSHSCGITTSGVLKCWGRNSNGELGDGSYTNRTTPVVIDAGVSYTKVNAEGSSTCGITTTGVLKCWGSNTNGILDLYWAPTALLPQRIF